ncbi:MAG: hypothetical protein HKO87_01280 [Acidimicrobiia bacterium]|nr:hypothetical protein [Acidimicrobiia bacterium]
MTTRLRSVLAFVMVLTVAATACADLTVDDAIDFVEGFGGEADYDPCTVGHDDRPITDPECAAAQVEEKIEERKEARKLDAEATALLEDRDYEKARKKLDEAISVAPWAQDLRARRASLDVARGQEPMTVDLVGYGANRDPLETQGMLASEYADFLDSLRETGGVDPEVVANISAAFCELKAAFIEGFEALEGKDQTKRLLQINRGLRYQDIACG